MTSDNYNQQYYKKNKDRLSEKRRKKYENDPEYREKIVGNSRKRASMIEKPSRAAVKRQPKTYLEADGSRKYSITFVAWAVKRSIQTIRKWEKDGILPKTPFRSPSGMRLYTQPMIDIVSEVIIGRGMARLPNKDKTIYTEIADKWKEIEVEAIKT